MHPGIDAVLTYLFKTSTVWRPFDLELSNFGQVITFVGLVSMETALTYDPTCVSVKSQFF